MTRTTAIHIQVRHAVILGDQTGQVGDVPTDFGTGTHGDEGPTDPEGSKFAGCSDP